MVPFYVKVVLHTFEILPTPIEINHNRVDIWDYLD